jgi:hypothetical protein
LQAERLMAHMRALCSEIGPRPACSPQERQAADYVRRTLADLGYADVRIQRFRSSRSYVEQAIPAVAGLALATPLAGLAGRRGRLIGGLLALAGALTLRNLLVARPPLYQPLIARGEGQNVFAVVPPHGEVKRRLYLIGHLDTNRQRFMFPPSPPGLLKPFLTVSLLLGLVSGAHLLSPARRRRLPLWQWAASLVAWASLAAMAADESQPFVDGANDNASAVSVLLGVAEALRAHSLAHTEVTLLFTGSEEPNSVGMHAFLDSVAPPRHNTYFIDLEMVGSVNICYVTRHGISKLTEYAPHPDLLAAARAAAPKHPNLGIAGKDMLMLEEVAALTHRGYKALCIAGYNQEGFLPNWHRLSDTLERIEPGTLLRAAQFTWAVMHEVDALPEQ